MVGADDFYYSGYLSDSLLVFDKTWMETTNVEAFLGTVWWSLLCICAGFAAGIWLHPRISHWLDR